MRHLPISYGTVAEKRPLESLLLERVLSNFFFVDRHAQARLRVWRHGATYFVDCKDSSTTSCLQGTSACTDSQMM